MGILLKKNSPIKFKRPDSVMARVLCSIENGHNTLRAIQKETKLKAGQVSAAVANLAYVGAIKTGKRGKDGKAYYETTAETIAGFAPCLKGVRSVFEPRS